METHLPNKSLHAHQKVMWWDSLAADRSHAQHLYVVMVILKSRSSLSSMYFCIIVLHDCVPKPQASSSESNNRIYCVSSARSEVQVNYVIYENYYIRWLLLYS